MKHFNLLFTIILSLSISACGGGTSANNVGTGARDDVQLNSGTKSISISWDIPTHRASGTSTLLPPDEIGGYKIYVSTNSNFIPSLPLVTISNGDTSNYVIRNLKSGTYTIYITTYDTSGDESEYSSGISKTI